LADRERFQPGEFAKVVDRGIGDPGVCLQIQGLQPG
jgi:hypothetical protein